MNLKKVSIIRWILIMLGCFLLIISLIPTMKPTKVIPKSIDKEAKIALKAYPELENVTIKFIIKPSLNKSFMKAQPNFWDLLRPFRKRSYRIYMSDTFELDQLSLKLTDIPSNIVVGWLAHELGHIMDYESRSTPSLIYYGIRYALSSGFVKEAERNADLFAINHNMVDYILATKRFILDNANLSESYKNHIRKNYLSPDEIIYIVQEREQEIEAKREDNPQNETKKTPI